MPPTFVPGLQLAREFYAAEVRPLLEDQFPGLRYAAALIGQGSEVAVTVRGKLDLGDITDGLRLADAADVGAAGHPVEVGETGHILAATSSPGIERNPAGRPAIA